MYNNSDETFYNLLSDHPNKSGTHVSQGKPLPWKSCRKWLRLGKRFVWGGVSGNHQDGSAGVCHVNGELRFGCCLRLLAGWGEGSTEEQWHLSAFLSRESDPYLSLPTPCLEASEFSSSSFIPGAFRAAASAVELRASE